MGELEGLDRTKPPDFPHIKENFSCVMTFELEHQCFVLFWRKVATWNTFYFLVPRALALGGCSSIHHQLCWVSSFSAHPANPWTYQSALFLKPTSLHISIHPTGSLSLQNPEKHRFPLFFKSILTFHPRRYPRLILVFLYFGPGIRHEFKVSLAIFNGAWYWKIKSVALVLVFLVFF